MCQSHLHISISCWSRLHSSFPLVVSFSPWATPPHIVLLIFNRVYRFWFTLTHSLIVNQHNSTNSTANQNKSSVKPFFYLFNLNRKCSWVPIDLLNQLIKSRFQNHAQRKTSQQILQIIILIKVLMSKKGLQRLLGRMRLLVEINKVIMSFIKTVLKATNKNYKY